jgi:hypothetical protein
MDISYWSRIKDGRDSCLRLFPLLSSMFVIDMIVDVWAYELNEKRLDFKLMNLMENGWISFACDCLGVLA